MGSEQEKLEYVLDFIEENPSPSHAVGLEQKKLYTFVSLFLDFLMSPSHTVGSEQEQNRRKY